MITIGMNYHVIPGKESQFTKAFEDVANALAQADGHEESRLYSEHGEPSKFLIISHWKDQAAFQAFITSDAFRNVTNWGASEILIGRPTHKIY
ncbi:antibiotic biosynthesis monooxygenase [Candidatus Methylospira mobilis]|uniref:antibiotic biosynthesis monooxygenase family protein n=1 Tax=Candidatus Methylospira mobilis TaxID=1808979 RepID=UPI0028EC9B52|nr:antibiotic biosynthesis monooxygenase [Candidatus Methylospira mobilis]WNV06163.1 antibiotic biosynthesis monooxygenase [Candidatus Methylospira mobilis]